MYVSGDGVQCNELMNFGGHCSTYGCRFCLTKGKHRGDVKNKDGIVGEGTHGMYFQDGKALMRSRDSLLKKDDSEVYVSMIVFAYVILYLSFHHIRQITTTTLIFLVFLVI